MSTACKTRYEVQKIIVDVLGEGLTAYLGNTHGISIMEFAQASFQNADKIVLMNPIRTSRIGWQGHTYKTVNTNLVRTDDWCEEQHWQLSVILKRKESPAITDMQATDLADTLITWINGEGALRFKKNKCASLRVAADSVIVYNDDSELYQKRAVFTVKLQVPKELSIGVIDAEAIVPKIKPV